MLKPSTLLFGLETNSGSCVADVSRLKRRSEADSCYKYKKNSYRKCTGWFGWDCFTYYYSVSECCDGYIGNTCSNPKCRRGHGSYTCNIDNEGYVVHKDGAVVKNSGGECYEPSKCRHCNKGYYPVTSHGGYCKACKKPSRCNLPKCTSSSNYWCEYCEGEYNRDRPGYNVYTGKPDITKCQRACSWKYGARCFPGTCTGNMILSEDCRCAKGFSSIGDCSTATSWNTPAITTMKLKLHGSSNKVKIIDKSQSKEMFWTNDTDWSGIALEVVTNYTAEIDRYNKPNYINGYYIGIEKLMMELTLSRGSNSKAWFIDGGCTNFNENCVKKITNTVLSSIVSWRQILNYRDFKHADSIKFKVSAKNGGKILYEDRSKFVPPYRVGQYFLSGRTRIEELVLSFDLFPPQHCIEISKSCAQDALTAADFLSKPTLTVFWDGWTDADSGIDEYELNIYYLENSLHNNLLEHKYLLSEASFSSLQSSARVELEAPGPYSVELVVHDRAGNHKVARRIILYDNASHVDLYGKPATIVQAQATGWINKLSSHIEIKWQHRFRNIRHSNGGWLNAVRSIKEITRDLDDREGRSNRTVYRLNNIDGIVRFDIARTVEINGISTYNKYEPVPDWFFIPERMIYTDEEFVDGKKLKYSIRGVDAIGKYAEDTVTALIDLSPPTIQKLWLSQSGRSDSIRSMLEKKRLRVEMEAFDFHSGIKAVSWKIFDNFTENEVVHGNSNVPIQLKTRTKSECIDGYSSRAQAAKCYCSPYNGCFDRHFLFKPQASIGNSSIILNEKESVANNAGFFLEVMVTNNAGLETEEVKRVTL